jgi:hypothetical protein
MKVDSPHNTWRFCCPVTTFRINSAFRAESSQSSLLCYKNIKCLQNKKWAKRQVWREEDVGLEMKRVSSYYHFPKGSQRHLELDHPRVQSLCRTQGRCIHQTNRASFSFCKVPGVQKTMQGFLHSSSSSMAPPVLSRCKAALRALDTCGSQLPPSYMLRFAWLQFPFFKKGSIFSTLASRRENEHIKGY